jgi:hypothetical protein
MPDETAAPQRAAPVTRSRTFGCREQRAVFDDDELELTNLLGDDSAEATEHEQHGEDRSAAPAANRTADESTATMYTLGGTDAML